MKLLDAFLDLLFPPKCPFCGKVQEKRGICPGCQKALPWAEGDQGLKRLPGGTVCAAPLWYEDLVRDGLLRFKFQGVSAAAEPIGELIAQCARGAVFRRVRRGHLGSGQPPAAAEAGLRPGAAAGGERLPVWGVKPERLLRKVQDNPAQSGLTEAAAAGPTCWGSMRRWDRSRFRAGECCWWMISAPPAPLWPSAPGRCVPLGRLRWSA